VNIVQITPGAGKMFCGGCLRDNALVAALRKLGHSVLMVPLYLPLTLDEEDQSAGTPIFFGGINVYLGEKSHFFRHAPNWLHQFLATPTLLNWASGSAAKTRAQDLGKITISMLRGENGHQARELNELILWLKQNENPDLICLSNALLVGLARQLKNELRVPILCSLQGEDFFIDALPPAQRERAWQIAAERAAEVDLFVAPSRYFANLMSARLKIPAHKIKIVFNGISLDGWSPTQNSKFKTQNFPTLGFFARMCCEKGLDTLVEAFIDLKKRGRVQNLKLKIGGSCGSAEQPFVEALRERLRAEKILNDVEFHPNLSRADKINFLQSLSVFSVPATYGEAFGLYVIEALAAGVPVVQPRHGAFPELIEATGGGVLCEPNNSQSLADAIENLLLNEDQARQLGETGHKNVFAKFSAEKMARDMAGIYSEAVAHFSIVNRQS